MSCDLGIQRVTREAVENKPWFQYKEGDQYFGTKAAGKYNEFRTIPTDEKYTSNV